MLSSPISNEDLVAARYHMDYTMSWIIGQKYSVYIRINISKYKEELTRAYTRVGKLDSAKLSETKTLEEISTATGSQYYSVLPRALLLLLHHSNLL